MKSTVVSTLSRLSLLSGLLLGLLFLNGCRTMEGAGKDIETAGESIQRNSK